VRAALGRDSPDPHRLLGMGGPDDALVAGRLAVRDAVLERIDWLGCRGKAARVVVEVRMPEVATVSDTVKILRWLAEEGQTIERGQALVEVETDKATVVVESAHRGTLRTIVHKVGDDVPTGQVIATFETEGRTGGGTLEDRPATTATPVPDEPAPAASEPAARGAGSFFARNRQADRPALTEPQSEGRPNSPGGPLPG
ncbi:MAG TPA: lipoyl domain-containing protein, partial [Isosphaeraceae bacterium]|nr:lipoyl domain-containing protein [Isosphaeraceae bacterium]